MTVHSQRILAKLRSIRTLVLLILVFGFHVVLAEGAARASVARPQSAPGEPVETSESRLAELRHLLATTKDLSGKDLSNLDLSQMDFSGANLTNANLSHADLYQANFSKANLTRANLKSASMEMANFSGALLREAQLNDASLYNAVLDEADLENAVLRRCYAAGTTLWKTNLKCADLRSSNFSGASYEEIVLDGALLGDTLFAKDLKNLKIVHPGRDICVQTSEPAPAAIAATGAGKADLQKPRFAGLAAKETAVPKRDEKKAVEKSRMAETFGPGEAPTRKLSATTRLLVKRFDFAGNKAISTAELNGIANGYTGRELTTEKLEEMRQALIALYIRKGYINSGVIIPDQNVQDGVIKLTVIEGRLTEVKVAGLDRYKKSYISDRLGLNSASPLNINELQERLQLLQQDPRIKRINAELKPSEQGRPGEASLDVKLVEASPYKMTLRFHNDAAPSTGPYRGELSLAHRNVLGFGDTVNLDLGGTEGALDYGGGYTFPISYLDTSVNAYYRRSDSSVIEESFRGLDIRSESETYGLKFRRPFRQTLTGEFALSLAGELRQSQSRLLGRNFSFSPGEHDGAARVSVLRFGQEYVRRDNRSLLAVTSTFNYGLSLLDATTNRYEPDSRFFSWLGQVMWLSQIGRTPYQVMLRTNAQVAANGLLPLEKFGLGGMSSVRGYRSNVLVRDNGINGALELRVPVLNDEKKWGVVQLVPFADFGRGWNTGAPTPRPDAIISIGGGIKWSFLDRYLFELYYGYGFEAVPVESRELADQGVHFQLSGEVF